MCSNKLIHEPIWGDYSGLPGQRFSCRIGILSAMGWTEAGNMLICKYYNILAMLIAILCFNSHFRRLIFGVGLDYLLLLGNSTAFDLYTNNNNRQCNKNRSKIQESKVDCRLLINNSELIVSKKNL